MRKNAHIVGFALCSLFLCACASQAPLDDAYHWPDKKSAAVVESTYTSQTTSANQVSQTSPTMEVVNQQDTTITVKIKR